MSIQVKKSAERGYIDEGWNNSYHTFSFENYHDPQLEGFRAIQVIKEDRVTPQNGFPLHSHKDMEIISLVLEGSLSHRDSLGNESSIQAGQIQLISAGTGIAHSVHNASKTAPVHFLQIWIAPDKKGYTPRYEQKSFMPYTGKEMLLATPDGHNGSLSIRQDVTVSYVTLKKSEEFTRTLKALRFGWIQVTRGDLAINGIPMRTGDGASIENVSQITVQAITPSEFLFFDLH